jgi:hypothetical protein
MDNILKTTEMQVCPICATAPKLSGLFRYQVRCGCGACGPKQPTQQEAVTRWNSVVYFVRKFRASNVLGRDSNCKPALC